MAKFVFLAVLLLAAIAASMAAPAEDTEFQVRQDHLRVRRATCNIPVIGGIVNDSACAGHCLTRGKAGGTCRDGICHCRKETLKELWDKRFG